MAWAGARDEGEEGGSTPEGVFGQHQDPRESRNLGRSSSGRGKETNPMGETLNRSLKTKKRKGRRRRRTEVHNTQQKASQREGKQGSTRKAKAAKAETSRYGRRKKRRRRRKRSLDGGFMAKLFGFLVLQQQNQNCLSELLETTILTMVAQQYEEGAPGNQKTISQAVNDTRI